MGRLIAGGMGFIPNVFNFDGSFLGDFGHCLFELLAVLQGLGEVVGLEEQILRDVQGFGIIDFEPSPRVEPNL